MAFNSFVFGHDSLSGFLLREGGKIAKVSVVGEDIGSANTGSNTTSINTDGIKTKTEGGVGDPCTRNRFGAGIGVAASIGNGGATD